MKKAIAMTLLLTVILGIVSCAETGPDDTTTPQDTTPIETTPQQTTPEETTNMQVTDPNLDPLDPAKEYNILFIGNSYTYYNSMPGAIFKMITKKAGYNVNVTSITKGGWSLSQHADENDEMGKQVHEALKKNKYDYVIVQGQSTQPIDSPDKFYDGVRAIIKKVKDNGATPILYSTWGRKTGNSYLTESKNTNETMTWKVAAAYEAIGKELGVDVAYVGLAFYDVYTNNPLNIELYHTDFHHSSFAGSYLAALTFFAKIFKADPHSTEFTGSLTADEAGKLMDAAYKAVYNTPAIPEKYKTSSEGVTNEGKSLVDYSKMDNLKTFPKSELISVLKGGSYPNGKSFSGILGTKNAIASKEYSTTGLTDAQKADIADIGYGVSVIGAEKMDAASKGYTTAIENFVNGHWGSSFMANLEFDTNKYNEKGEVDANGKYTALITLNFGSLMKFDAVGFSSGSLQGFPGAAEVYVSKDGKEWTLVPTACWDAVNGDALTSAGKTPADPWNGNSGTVTCLFGMDGAEGQYVRIGVVIGRSDKASMYNTVNTREILAYGSKLG